MFGIDLSLGQELTIIGILMVTSKGAAGVTGSGFIVLASTLTAVKAVMLEIPQAMEALNAVLNAPKLTPRAIL